MKSIHLIPYLLYSAFASLERDKLSRHAALIFRASSAEISCIHAELCRKVGQAILRLSVRLVQNELYVVWQISLISPRRSDAAAFCDIGISDGRTIVNQCATFALPRTARDLDSSAFFRLGD